MKYEVARVATLALGLASACGSRSPLDIVTYGLADASGGADVAPHADVNIVADAPNQPPCTRGVVASTLLDPWFIAIDEESVYWIDQGSRSVPDDSRLGRCPKAGCPGAPEVLAGPMTGAGGLALGGASVYWTEPANESLLTCAKSTCAPHTLFFDPRDAPITLLADGANLDILSYHSVEICAAIGCTGPTKFLSLSPGGLAIAADPASIFFSVASAAGAPPGGAIYACDKPTCQNGLHVIATALRGAPWGMTVDATDIYFVIGGAASDPDGAGEVRACPKSGCASHASVLVTGRNHPTSLVSDTDRVYWIEQGTAAHGFADGVVASCPKSGCGGAPTIVAEAQYLPTSIALDHGCVYWATSGDTGSPGSIQRAPTGG